MFSILKARLFQGYRTGAFPPAAPKLPPHFMGRPEVEPEAIPEDAASICPVGALDSQGEDRGIDLGRCIFCGKCAGVPGIKFTREYRMGAMTRGGLLADGRHFEPDKQQNEVIKKLCGRSLKIRQVSAGGCAACELDFNVLNTLAWDMGRFGIQAVASPRHADCVLVTGPVTKNMRLALEKTYEAMPRPCFVIACGSCAISGGLYRGTPESSDGVETLFPVDLYVPGCPPHPATLLEALLRFLGK
ncbi:MAG: NADH-quinone oxidoreductase subunit NuoB [Victivallaceae bacterium]|nr:NADH-quinone oxidoreductase subunit NuoB [Victivallaceae bacterium]